MVFKSSLNNNSGGGGGTPAGSSGAVQFNNGGAFGGFGSWNGSTQLTIPGNIKFSSSSTALLLDLNNAQSIDVYGRSLSDSSNSNRLFWNGNGVQIQGDLTPSADNTYNNGGGSSGYAWSNVLTNELTIGGQSIGTVGQIYNNSGSFNIQANSGTVYIAGNVDPSVANNYTLGESNQWDNINTNQINGQAAVVMYGTPTFNTVEAGDFYGGNFHTGSGAEFSNDTLSSGSGTLYVSSNLSVSGYLMDGTPNASIDLYYRDLLAYDGSTTNLSWDTPGTTAIYGTLMFASGGIIADSSDITTLDVFNRTLDASNGTTNLSFGTAGTVTTVNNTLDDGSGHIKAATGYYVSTTPGATGVDGLGNTFSGGMSTAVGIKAPALIVGISRFPAQTAAKALATLTVPGADNTYMVSANVNVTTSTAFSFNVTCTYTDETNTSRTLNLSFSNLAGTFLQTITNVLGAGAYEGIPLLIRAKAGTTIIIASTGTFTTVTYNIEERIIQL